MSRSHHPGSPRAPRRSLATLRGLRADQRGSMLIFGLFVFAVMLALGGLGVDTMRTEALRVRLQSTLDRAVLAAADLDQTRDPATVVRDHFDRAGLAAALGGIEVVQTLNTRTVKASAQLPLKTSLLRMAGIAELTAPAIGTATESRSDVEIGLVLDVSGSMNSNNRLPRLKTAGAEFIDTMFTNIGAEHLAISMVPYSTQVNLGRDLSAALGMPARHAYSYCADLPDAAYLTTLASPLPLVQAGHFDTNGFDPAPRSVGSYAGMAARTPVCRSGADFEVLPWSNNRSALKTRLAGLRAEGWTSIEMGVNWGTALIDPAVRGALTTMGGPLRPSAQLAGWPRDFGAEHSMKVLVVMTDGANTVDYALKSPWRDNGLSDVWLSGSDEYYVARATGDFFRAKTQTLVATRPANAVQLRWAELFARMTVREHAHHLRALQPGLTSLQRQLAFEQWTTAIVDTQYTALKDTRLSRICAAARARGVLIFTIGFEVNEPGAAQAMADCASSPSHYYGVEGLEIARAFTSIATQINQLRLVQ